ncbi:MAG TPA: hypothetical protein VJ953_21685 [Saprospiraceae bacterium]|nr:hypothetical protein [Saprospiraceae bacterium]
MDKNRMDHFASVLGNSTSRTKKASSFKAFGSKTGYYRPPIRTGDLIEGAHFANANFGQSFPDEFYIAPSKVRLDRLAERQLDEIAKKVGTISDEAFPNADQILSSSLGEILEQFAGKGKAEDGLVKVLKKDNKTGVLIQVAKKLNASKLDPITRAVLSRKNLYIYTAYRAILGLGVSDMEGIVSGIKESISKVKAELNRRLVRRVIEIRNLKASNELIQRIQSTLAEREISYAPGAVEAQIIELYNQYKKTGNVLSMIQEFLDLDKVEIPDGMDRDEVIAKMLDFLVEIGFAEEADGGQSEQEAQPEIPKDHFDKAIVEIGDHREKLLYDQGVFTYGQLANTSTADLKKILGAGVSDQILERIIGQASLINQGHFDRLLNLQEEMRNGGA